jgi:hypothetical protein
LRFQGESKGNMDASVLLTYFNAGVPGMHRIEDGVKS